MQELENKIDEHVIVTAPDRYFQDAIVVLLIDWPPDLVNQALAAIEKSQKKLAIHIFDYNDHSYNWAIDVANQAHIVAMDITNINHIDLIKGYLISKPNSFYFGRMDINKLFSNYTNDPIGHLVIKLGNIISQMEEK